MAHTPVPPSSVRVEIVDAADSAELGGRFESAPTRAGRGRGLVVLGGIAAVALVAVLLRPDDGTTAIGTPIEEFAGAPSSIFGTATDPSPAVGSGLDDDSEGGPDRAVLDGFLSRVVDAEFGWVGLKWGGAGPELVRSIDGLAWTPVRENAPEGNIVGFDIIDGELLAAVSRGVADTSGDWPISQIDIWRLPDEGEWEKATEYGSHRGRRDVWSAVFVDDAVVFSSMAPVDDPAPSPYVVDELRGVLEPDLAAQVCAATRVSTEPDTSSTDAIDFFDCAGAVIARTVDAELQGVRPGQIVRCLEGLAWSASSQPEVVRFQKRARPSIVELQPALELQLGSVVPTRDGFVALSYPTPMYGAADGCRHHAEPTRRLHRWAPATGLVEVSVEEEAPGSEFSTFLLAGVDGGLLWMTESAVYETSVDFDEFRLVIENPFPDGTLQPSASGLQFFAVTHDRAAVSTAAGSWLEIETASLRYPWVVLATDSFAVLLESMDSRPELVKVPLIA